MILTSLPGSVFTGTTDIQTADHECLEIGMHIIQRMDNTSLVPRTWERGTQIFYPWTGCAAVISARCYQLGATPMVV